MYFVCFIFTEILKKILGGQLGTFREMYKGPVRLYGVLIAVARRRFVGLP